MASSNGKSEKKPSETIARSVRDNSWQQSLWTTATFGALVVGSVGLPAAQAQTAGPDNLTPGTIDGGTIVDGLAGNDTISFFGTDNIGDAGGNGTVTGGADDDLIQLQNSNVAVVVGSEGQVLGDDGNDTIEVYDSYVGYYGSATISGGANNDSIAVARSTIGHYISGTGQILGDDGNDTITFDNSYVGFSGNGTVSGGDGDDLIELQNNSRLGTYFTSTGIVQGDSGNDTITMFGGNVGVYGSGTISGGDNGDSITLQYASVGNSTGSSGEVLGDTGNDTITIADYSYIAVLGNGTVSGGDGNDSIALSRASGIAGQPGGVGLIQGDDGTDTISVDDSSAGVRGDASISGGDGNDSIAFENNSYIGEYAGATGVVSGDAGNDTITIDDTDIGDYGAATVAGGLGDDLIAITNDSDLADNVGASAMVLGENGNDTITVDGSDIGDEDDATISGGDGDDSILISGNSDIGDMAGATGQVLGDAGNDTITLTNSAVADFGDGTVSGGDGADLIALSGGVIGARTGDGIVQGDDGSDTITVDGVAVGLFSNGTVSGGDGNDSIILSNYTAIGYEAGSTGQVLGDAGNDTVSIDETVYFGAGTGLIDGGANSDTLAFAISDGVTANLSTLYDETRMVSFEALQKDDDGTLTINTAETFADGTTVNGGVLDFTGVGSVTSTNVSVLGGTLRTDGGAFGTGALIGLTGGTFDVNGNETITTLTNSGGLVDLASGVTLGVTNGFTQTDGTFANNGVFEGNITASGGLISGNGTINGDLAMSGTSILAPGNSIGVQTINGDLSLATGSSLLIEVADNQADQIVVNGGVAINGATLIADDLAGTAPSQDPTDSFIVISNDGSDSVTGTGFATVTDSLAFLDPIVTLNGGDGNDVVLSFVLPPVSVDPTTPTTTTPTLTTTGLGTTRNQRGVANALNTLLASPDAAGLIDAFTPLTFAQLDFALDDISGVQHAVNHFDANALNLFLSDSVIRAVDKAELFAATGKNHAFVDVFYRDGSVGADGIGGPASDVNGAGLIAGIGRALTKSFAAGVHLSYVDSDGEIDVRASDASAETTSVGGYARFEKSQLDLTGTFTYSESEVGTDRRIRVGTTTYTTASDYKISGLTGSVEGGYTATVGAATAVRTYLSLGLTDTDRDGFVETGSSLVNLTGAKDSHDLGYAKAGVRASQPFTANGTQFEPYVDIGLTELIGEATPETFLSFAAGSPGFRVYGAKVDQTRVHVGLGAAIRLGSTLKATVDYGGQFAEDADEQALRIGLTARF